MTIRVRSGIILTHICGQALLVAAFEARPHCPHVTVLNETGDIIWNCLKEKKNIPDIVLTLKKKFDIPSDMNVEELIKDYIAQLHDKGYVLYEEDSEQ